MKGAIKGRELVKIVHRKRGLLSGVTDPRIGKARGVLCYRQTARDLKLDGEAQELGFLCMENVNPRDLGLGLWENHQQPLFLQLDHRIARVDPLFRGVRCA